MVDIDDRAPPMADTSVKNVNIELAGRRETRVFFYRITAHMFSSRAVAGPCLSLRTIEAANSTLGTRVSSDFVSSTQSSRSVTADRARAQRCRNVERR